ncbi:hypothetical protein D3Z36_08130, partial [Lachnospiraceae bacterium]|nr:hypothetical protein [Lachnospiraceae bacterium]
MKLPELNKKFANRFSVRMAAGVLTVVVFGNSMSAYTVYAEKNGNITQEASKASGNPEKTEDAENETNKNKEKDEKQETVYFMSDAKGTIRDTIVIDHLLNKDGAETIEDHSTLIGIENVKGSETFKQSGESITWEAKGNDIYYRGKTSKEAPVSQKVTYLLDGKEMSPEEIAGKSGKVTIRFDYTNNTSYTAKIDGENRTVKVPLAAVTILMLDDKFSNIEVTNGRVEMNGENDVVIGYAFPGMKESLEMKDGDLDDDVEIPEYFEMTADVENFELSGAMTLVANVDEMLSSDENGKIDEKIDDMDEAVDDLVDATDQLVDGSDELADGTDSLKDGMDEFGEGTDALKDGIASYTSGVSQLSDGISQLSGKTPELSDGVSSLNSSASILFQGVSKLDASLNTAFTDKEKKVLQKQVGDMVAAEEKNIKESAKTIIEEQSGSIKGQAQAAVDAQA